MTEQHFITQYPALPTAYTAKPTRRIDMLIMHATGGKKTGDLYTLSGRDRRRLVSVHYYVTKAGEIFQLVQDANIAWHAGVSFWQGDEDLNRYSIGVELENFNDGRDPYPDAQIDAALWLVRSKVAQYAIPQSRLVRHAQIALPIGRKNDPLGFPWDTFVQQVYAPVETWPQLWMPRAEVWVREGPSTASPYARWQDGPWKGQQVKLPAGQPVTAIGRVTGELLTRPVYGTGDQWLALEVGGFVWLNQLRKVDG